MIVSTVLFYSSWCYKIASAPSRLSTFSFDIDLRRTGRGCVFLCRIKIGFNSLSLLHSTRALRHYIYIYTRRFCWLRGYLISSSFITMLLRCLYRVYVVMKSRMIPFQSKLQVKSKLFLWYYNDLSVGLRSNPLPLTCETLARFIFFLLPFCARFSLNASCKWACRKRSALHRKPYLHQSNGKLLKRSTECKTAYISVFGSFNIKTTVLCVSHCLWLNTFLRVLYTRVFFVSIR